VISRLPSWIWPVAWALAFVAGIVNVVGLLGFQHQAISHLTGNTSLLAVALTELNGAATGHFLGLIGAFVAGTALSGYIVGEANLELHARYAIALGLESILLFVSLPLFVHENSWGMYLAACACGLQNAMVSTFSGAVVRTTHVSGMFTDLGIFVGHALRGLPIDRKRTKLSLCVISGFLGGGIIGSIGMENVGYFVLLLPAAATGCAAAVYGAHRFLTRRSTRQ
jgi:uncharacterized membrane protein YoaK (UPF0700 family)